MKQNNSTYLYNTNVQPNLSLLSIILITEISQELFGEIIKRVFVHLDKVLTVNFSLSISMRSGPLMSLHLNTSAWEYMFKPVNHSVTFEFVHWDMGCKQNNQS